jgi:hypothetical protein
MPGKRAASPLHQQRALRGTTPPPVNGPREWPQRQDSAGRLRIARQFSATNRPRPQRRLFFLQSCNALDTARADLHAGPPSQWKLPSSLLHAESVDGEGGRRSGGKRVARAAYPLDTFGWVALSLLESAGAALEANLSNDARTFAYSARAIQPAACKHDNNRVPRRTWSPHRPTYR